MYEFVGVYREFVAKFGCYTDERSVLDDKDRYLIHESQALEQDILLVYGFFLGFSGAVQRILGELAQGRTSSFHIFSAPTSRTRKRRFLTRSS